MQDEQTLPLEKKNFKLCNILGFVKEKNILKTVCKL